MRDFSSQIHWLNARLHIVVAIIVALLVSVGFGISAGEGDFRFVYIALFGAAVATIMVMLGEKYWLLVPFSLTSQLPAIPMMGKVVDLPELIITACTLTFAVRFALRKQKFTLFHAAFTPILLYIAWVGMIFAGNPVGLEAMGADTGGARFYAKLLLAFASFLILVNQRITERDCRTIVILALVGSALSTGNSILTYLRPSAENQLAAAASLDPDAFYTWHQSIAIVPLMVVMILLSRFRSSELFSLHRLGLLALMVACCILILLSGKRAAVAAIPLSFVAAAFIRKEYGFVLFWLASAVVVLAAVVTLHGTLFTLPMATQRALSWLPGRWDPSLENMQGGKDEFREGLRELAIEKIKRDPWVGKGYAVDRVLAARLASLPGFGTEKLVLMMAAGSSWHNTWLGYAADFGIPLSVLQAVIYCYVVWIGWKLLKRLPLNSMHQTVVFYVVLHTIRDIGGSHYEGHSSVGPFLRWWMYGIVVSLALHTRQAPSDDASSPLERAEDPSPRAPGSREARRPPLAAAPAFRRTSHPRA